MENTKKKTSRLFTEEQKKEIIDKYQSGKFTIRELARQYSFSHPGVGDMLKKYGVKINSDLCFLNRKYEVNEKYFEKIDNEKKAYWLGFLYADGYNSEKRKSITLGLAETDKDHISKFMNDIGHKGRISITTYKKHPARQRSFTVSIRSATLSEDLSRLGCFQKKSLTLKFPTEDQVPSQMLRHFVRGYFDGDGCFSVVQSKGKRPENQKVKKFRASITSSVYFCESLFKILAEKLDIRSKITARKRFRPTRNVEVNNTVMAFKFLDWIYHDSSVYLDRKYNKYVSERLDICRRRELRKMPKIDDPEVIIIKCNYKTAETKNPDQNFLVGDV